MSQQKIILMEDHEETGRNIKKIFEKKYHGYFQVEITTKSEQTLQFANDSETNIFVLDVSMGTRERSQEGLDTLQKIKIKAPKKFVCIWSAKPEYERLAKNLDADIFVHKTKNLENNVNEMSSGLLMYDIERRKSSFAVNDMETQALLVGEELEDEDKNLQAYHNYLKKSKWFQSNKGKYVCFVDGVLRGANPNRTELLRYMAAEYPNRERFVIQVEEEELEIEIPSFEIIDFPINYDKV